MIFLYLITLTCLSFVVAQKEIFTKECGKDVACFIIPRGCNSSIDCEIIVHYKFKNGKIGVTMAVTPLLGYFGWAQSMRNSSMAGAKGVVCYYDGSSVKLESFQTASNAPPILEPLSNGYNLSSAYKTDSGASVCQFERTVTVPSGSENLMHDLTDPIYILYATGEFNNGLQYHQGNRLITPRKIDLSPTFQEIDTNECGKSFECFTFPNGCKSSESCTILVQYKFEDGKIDVIMSTNPSLGYVGWAQSMQSSSMAGAKGVVCYYDGSSVRLESFQTASNGQPNLESLSNGYTLSSAYRTDSGATVCQFQRTVIVPGGSENLMHDLTDPVHVLYASGNFNNGLQYHQGNRLITANKLDLSPSSV